jgi:hypothetical protein
MISGKYSTSKYRKPFCANTDEADHCIYALWLVACIPTMLIGLLIYTRGKRLCVLMVDSSSRDCQSHILHIARAQRLRILLAPRRGQRTHLGTTADRTNRHRTMDIQRSDRTHRQRAYPGTLYTIYKRSLIYTNQSAMQVLYIQNGGVAIWIEQKSRILIVTYCRISFD